MPAAVPSLGWLAMCDAVLHMDQLDACHSGCLPACLWCCIPCRNLTITGLQGKDTVFDLEFKRALIELCSTCILRLTNITMANERRGTGTVYDLFIGQPGSKILAHNMYKLRIACTSAQHLAEVVSQTKRSTILPGSSKPQQFAFVDVTFQVCAATSGRGLCLGQGHGIDQ